MRWQSQSRDIALCRKIVELNAEYQQNTEVCYMHQEMLEGKYNQEEQVYFHRYRLVSPGLLGVFTPGGVNSNRVNINDLGMLLRNLNRLLVVNHEERSETVIG